MTLQFTIELPAELERTLHGAEAETNLLAKQAFALLLFHDGRLSHAELGRALSLDRFETDALLKRRSPALGGPTFSDLEADRTTLEAVLGPVRRDSSAG